jgi:hypothetical protein
MKKWKIPFEIHLPGKKRKTNNKQKFDTLLRYNKWKTISKRESTGSKGKAFKSSLKVRMSNSQCLLDAKKQKKTKKIVIAIIQ